MSPPSLFLYALLARCLLASAQLSPAQTVASQYSLTTSTSIPFPTATLTNSDAKTFITSSWSLSKGQIQTGQDDLAFVSDPFPNAPAPGSTGGSTNAPVLEVTYPATGFSTDSSGTQLYLLWNTTDGSQFNSMLLTYEVAFDANFPFAKGGKLPGLRGGPNPDGCSGGSAATGANCFSTRLMWRTQGQGEVYAYLPSSNNFCSNPDFLCNQDGFGTSIDRGSFSFAAGQWNHVTLLVLLNNAKGSANGQVSLFYNNVQAINETNIIYRDSSAINIGGLYLSTFFGGNDASWAPNVTTHSYFRNFQLYGSSAASTLPSSSLPNALLSSLTLERLLTVVIGVGAALLLDNHL